MPALRALNLAQHWLAEGADEKDAHKIRSMMTGPLETTIAPRIPDPNARKMPPTPWWWGNDEDASASAMAAMTAMRKRS